jgi:magnesium chelatase family protein
VAYRDLVISAPAESSAAIRARVEAARLRQRERFADADGVYANAHMSARDLRSFCPVSADVEEVLRTAITRLSLSARAYHRVLKIARTIADLAGEGDIGLPHVREAIQYRSLDRGGG